MPVSRADRIAELTADLASTRAAIRRIVESGQAYSAEGRAMTRADLMTLRALEKDQRTELDALERGTATRVYGVVHR